VTIVSKEENGKTVFRYREPDFDEFYEQIESLLEKVDDFVKSNEGLKLEEDVEFDMNLLSQIFLRVDKRSDYFEIFHDGTEINESKRTALICYWILKFKPFLCNKYYYFNEDFCIYLILCTISKNANNENKVINVTEKYYKKLLYAFRFWDLSKEALILIVETLNEAAIYVSLRENNENPE